MNPAPHARRILLLAALALCAYLPALRMPFVEDDYVIIPMSNTYAAQHWAPLWHDVDFRTRPMQLFMNVAIDRAFGYRPLPYYAANMLLHVLCVLLIYAAGAWMGLGFNASLWAAGFFAVYEGHAEAIVWPSGSSELLVFAFGMAAWVCWIKWLQESSALSYACALVCFFLALFSKESAWVLPAFMLLPICCGRALPHPAAIRRALIGLAPFLLIAALYVGWIWLTRVHRPGYGDIRFSLASPWPLVLAKSFWRMIFPWGLLAAAILLCPAASDARRQMGFAALWMAIGIFPYSFLTYMNQLPSRATYLAGAGLAMLIGAAAVHLVEQKRRTLLVVLGAIVLTANVEILWVKKMAQMRERVEPSELLKQAVAHASGPVTIECSPLLPIVAEVVVEQAGGTIAAEQGRRETHCFVIQYQSRTGETVRLDKPMASAKHSAFY